MSSEYLVRDWATAAKAMVPYVLGPAIILGFAALADIGFVLTGVACGVVLLLGINAARKASQALRVDSAGIMLNFPHSSGRGGLVYEQRLMRWSDVDEVILRSADESVQVVLTADAPLPGWMTARVVHPDDPQSRIRLRRTVKGLDVSACATAVREHASTVRVQVA